MAQQLLTGQRGARHVVAPAVDGVQHGLLEPPLPGRLLLKRDGQVVGGRQQEVDAARHAVDLAHFLGREGDFRVPRRLRCTKTCVGLSRCVHALLSRAAFGGQD